MPVRFEIMPPQFWHCFPKNLTGFIDQISFKSTLFLLEIPESVGKTKIE